MHFQCIIAGFTPEDEEKRIYWKEDFTPHPGHETKSSRKGKERASLGVESSTKARSREKKDRSSLGEGSKSPRVASKESGITKPTTSREAGSGN
ncbi:uncharacterized protein MYCFIDRAFT_180915 [Pseudocercospora fijiensis CIRAD86]|uniref:Uncharacterized protein n=1 Tax=Pseudocercospora fijiensis (strain CIRAD86) TaxID=383855 RepID=N1Q5Q1_PSEFD|nr:uncharacterized protein MYCFIDRAFT_180915 [Pseudocercospora fijiensis CIRAD86]EME87320.1 hypothetical protein MYCFIDRAFT_180915 [Pseudocercospora fijiensis CIRAD86]